MDSWVDRSEVEGRGLVVPFKLLKDPMESQVTETVIYTLFVNVC